MISTTTFRAAGVLLALSTLSCSVFGPGAPAAPNALEREPEAPGFRPMLVLPLPSLAEPDKHGTPLTKLSGRDSAIADVLLALFKDSNINLLIDPDVTGTATFDVKGTTVENAFESLLRTLDLAYEWDGEFLRVRTKKRELFHLDMLEASGTLGGAAGGGSGSSSSSITEGTSPWEQIEEDLQKIVGDGSILVNRRAGTIEIEATPSRVARARQYIDDVMRRITNQVSLEARILEVRLNDEFRLGVNWQILPGLLDTKKTGTLPGGAVLAQTAASGGTAFQFGLLDSDEYSIFVDALQMQGQVRVLSSPRVSTMNNVPATMRVVEQIPIIERDIIDGGGGIRTEFDVSFVEAGVKIQVVPQIGDGGMLTVQVVPSVTQQTGTVVTPDGLQTQPILATRETTTTVRIADGQTIVIGGLRSTRKSEVANGVPVLSDLPVIGALFRGTIQQRDEVEMMITLTPRILDSAWINEENRRGRDRLVMTRRPFYWSTLGLDDKPKEDYGRSFLNGKPTRGDQPGVRIDGQPKPTATTTGKSLTVTREGLGDLLAKRATDMYLRGDLLGTLSTLREVQRMDPSRTSALVFAALLEIQRARYVQARTLLDQVLLMKPDDAIALSARGSVEFYIGSPQAAETYFKKAKDAKPTPITSNNCAAALIADNKLSEARALLEAETKVENPPAEVWANLAHIQIQSGQLDAARTSLDKALAAGAHPRDPRIRALLAGLNRLAAKLPTK